MNALFSHFTFCPRCSCTGSWGVNGLSYLFLLSLSFYLGGLPGWELRRLSIGWQGFLFHSFSRGKGEKAGHQGVHVPYNPSFIRTTATIGMIPQPQPPLPHRLIQRPHTLRDRKEKKRREKKKGPWCLAGLVMLVFLRLPIDV